VFSKYLGDSEAYLRGLLARAREEAPCVILFDPLDSLAARRGAGSDSGVSERVLSTLLNELDGIEDRAGVFVIGVTDRVEQVDEAVLRPGRFDRVVQIPEPTDEDRSGIVDVLRKRTRMEDGVAERIVERTEGWTAGEIVGLVREAAGIAMRRSFEADQVSWADFEESFASVLRIRAETEE
jgi:SpoVK/Ycf46/Vps4 family AAA+-type ATPase